MAATYIDESLDAEVCFIVEDSVLNSNKICGLKRSEISLVHPDKKKRVTLYELENDSKPELAEAQSPEEDCRVFWDEKKETLSQIERADTEPSFEVEENPPNQLQLASQSVWLCITAPELEISYHSGPLLFDDSAEVADDRIPAPILAGLTPALRPWVSMDDEGQVKINVCGFLNYGQEFNQVLDARKTCPSYFRAICAAFCEEFLFSRDLWQGYKTQNSSELIAFSCDLCEMPFLELVELHGITRREMEFFVFRPAACVGERPCTVTHAVDKSLSTHLDSFRKGGKNRNLRDTMFICCMFCEQDRFVRCTCCETGRFAAGGAHLYHSKVEDDNKTTQ